MPRVPGTSESSTEEYTYATLPKRASFDIDGGDSGAGVSESKAPTSRWFTSQCMAKATWNHAGSSVRSFMIRNAGLLLVVLSQMFLSSMNLSVKFLNSLKEPISALELVFVRMAITWACSIIYMYAAKIPDPWLGPKEVRWLLALRGFTGFFGLFGIYFALQYLSLSDATVLTFLSPMVTGMVGALVLKENYTYREALAGLFSLLGVILIARPPFLFGHHDVSLEVPATADGHLSAEAVEPAERGTSAERMIAVGMAMVSVMGSVGAYTSIRAVGKRAHAMHLMTAFSTQCVIATVIGMIITKTPFVIPKQLLWVALLLQIGFFGFCAQICLTMGLQRETAGRGTLAVYTQIIFAAFFERIFFHVKPSLLSIVGSAIICSAALYTAFTKQKETPSAIQTVFTTEDISLEEGIRLMEPSGENEAGQEVKGRCS